MGLVHIRPLRKAAASNSSAVSAGNPPPPNKKSQLLVKNRHPSGPRQQRCIPGERVADSSASRTLILAGSQQHTLSEHGVADNCDALGCERIVGSTKSLDSGSIREQLPGQ